MANGLAAGAAAPKTQLQPLAPDRGIVPTPSIHKGVNGVHPFSPDPAAIARAAGRDGPAVRVLCDNNTGYRAMPGL